ncbi:hypothetical protein [Cryptosporangium phraense]|uniref:Uncharacterized protein n=1 Tax=Cryptosporangium phraense TaxID=2593070 RepID=A0A545AGF0_9ACTN|nr:hypothetical protein [Cryptosporangium phraense]TQS40406.1 hypothetical protein FL583_34755 [Cryptosporangium phraense]
MTPAQPLVPAQSAAPDEPSTAPETTETDPTTPTELPNAPAPDDAPSDDNTPTGPHVLAADRPSTPEERQLVRVSLGWRYDTEAREIVVLLAERPGIRTAAAGQADAMVTELVALRAFLAADPGALVTAQRTGRIGTDGPLLACVTGGLRRVPSYRGVAFATVPGGAHAGRGHYRPGRLLWEPAPVVASARRTAVRPDDVDFVLWSSTGRRCEDFVPDRETLPIIFSPSTRFGVLATEETAAGGFRVYLTEVRTRDLHRWTGETAEADDRILTRLRDAARNAPAAGPSAAVPLIGFKPDDQPFTPPAD